MSLTYSINLFPVIRLYQKKLDRRHESMVKPKTILPLVPAIAILVSHFLYLSKL